MSWATIIAEILKVLGPLLSEWLSKWLDGRLKAVVRKGGWTEAARPVPAAGGRLLLNEVLDATPRRMVFRRALLRKCCDVIPPALGGGKLAKADAAEIKGLAAAAEQ